MTLLSYGCHGVGPLRSPGSELTQLLSVLNMSNTSLRSKRFRKQRKDRCFARAKNGTRTKQPHFSRGQNIENPFLGLSLLPNPTETLATQASLIPVFFYLRELRLDQNSLRGD